MVRTRSSAVTSGGSWRLASADDAQAQARELGHAPVMHEAVVAAGGIVAGDRRFHRSSLLPSAPACEGRGAQGEQASPRSRDLAGWRCAMTPAGRSDAIVGGHHVAHDRGQAHVPAS